jgi:hypothetical protein
MSTTKKTFVVPAPPLSKTLVRTLPSYFYILSFHTAIHQSILATVYDVKLGLIRQVSIMDSFPLDSYRFSIRVTATPKTTPSSGEPPTVEQARDRLGAFLRENGIFLSSIVPTVSFEESNKTDRKIHPIHMASSTSRNKRSSCCCWVFEALMSFTMAKHFERALDHCSDDESPISAYTFSFAVESIPFANAIEWISVRFPVSMNMATESTGNCGAPNWRRPPILYQGEIYYEAGGDTQQHREVLKMSTLRRSTIPPISSPLARFLISTRFDLLIRLSDTTDFFDRLLALEGLSGFSSSMPTTFTPKMILMSAYMFSMTCLNLPISHCLVLLGHKPIGASVAAVFQPSVMNIVDKLLDTVYFGQNYVRFRDDIVRVRSSSLIESRFLHSSSSIATEATKPQPTPSVLAGGLVLKPRACGHVFRSVGVYDVVSMYPSLVCEFCIDPVTLVAAVNGILTTTTTTRKRRRLNHAKDTQEEEEEEEERDTTTEFDDGDGDGIIIDEEDDEYLALLALRMRAEVLTATPLATSDPLSTAQQTSSSSSSTLPPMVALIRHFVQWRQSMQSEHVTQTLLSMCTSTGTTTSSPRVAAVLRDLVIRTHPTAFKMLANATVGNLGCVRSRYYCPTLNSIVTLQGRRLLTFLSTSLSTEAAKNTTVGTVLYGDSDSLFVQLPLAEKTGGGGEAAKYLAKLNSYLSLSPEMGGLGFKNNVVALKLEGVYQSIVFVSKKRYFGKLLYPMTTTTTTTTTTTSTTSTVLVVKGMEAIRRDWPLIYRQYFMSLYDRILLSDDGDLFTMQHAVEHLVEWHKTKEISSTTDWAVERKVPGKQQHQTVVYYTSGTGGTDWCLLSDFATMSDSTIATVEYYEKRLLIPAFVRLATVVFANETAESGIRIALSEHFEFLSMSGPPVAAMLDDETTTRTIISTATMTTPLELFDLFFPPSSLIEDETTPSSASSLSLIEKASQRILTILMHTHPSGGGGEGGGMMKGNRYFFCTCCKAVDLSMQDILDSSTTTTPATLITEGEGHWSSFQLICPECQAENTISTEVSDSDTMELLRHLMFIGEISRSKTENKIGSIAAVLYRRLTSIPYFRVDCDSLFSCLK